MYVMVFTLRPPLADTSLQGGLLPDLYIIHALGQLAEQVNFLACFRQLASSCRRQGFGEQKPRANS